MKKIIFLICAGVAITPLAMAHCGSCGVGDSKGEVVCSVCKDQGEKAKSCTACKAKHKEKHKEECKKSGKSEEECRAFVDSQAADSEELKKAAPAKKAEPKAAAPEATVDPQKKK